MRTPRERASAIRASASTMLGSRHPQGSPSVISTGPHRRHGGILALDLEALIGDWAFLFLFTIMIAGVTGGAIKSGGVAAVGHAIGFDFEVSANPRQGFVKRLVTSKEHLVPARTP